VLLTQKKAPGARPDRFPLIVEAVNHLKIRSCLIDGEAVCCDGDGLASFTPLRRRRDDPRVSSTPLI
jgi:ATP-dependent DNA ligase